MSPPVMASALRPDFMLATVGTAEQSDSDVHDCEFTRPVGRTPPSITSLPITSMPTIEYSQRPYGSTSKLDNRAECRST